MVQQGQGKADYFNSGVSYKQTDINSATHIATLIESDLKVSIISPDGATYAECALRGWLET